MSSPLFATRTLYAPGHFGNTYEVIGDNEFRTLMLQCKEWGFNEYSDWFDPENCADPFVEPLYELGQSYRVTKKKRFLIAQEIGLPAVLVITPNVVYLEQCQPEAAAVKSGRIFGPLLCPSKPSGRETILRNHENWLRDLAEAGVKLHALGACPYDFGGCACEQCKPWILTFANLCREIYAIAERYHPGIEMRMVGWWWLPEEHRQFAEWADVHAPGWVKSITLHIPYEDSDVADVPLPRGCARQAFVHIGYAEAAKPRDSYAHLGPVMAAERIERTIKALHARGCTGWMAYSEGVFDDVNKMVLASLSVGKHAGANEALRAYVTRHVAPRTTRPDVWVSWLKRWGWPFDNDTVRAQRELGEMRAEAALGEWRFRQWELKSELMHEHAMVKAAGETTPAGREAIERYWAVHERIMRGIYGMGPQRHGLAKQFAPLFWQNAELKKLWAKDA